MYRLSQRLVGASFLAALGLPGCSADTAPFVPLNKLCERYAQEVCAARSVCCDDGASGCEEATQASCESVRADVAQHASRSYDSTKAARRLDALRDELSDCAPPYAPESFFSGGAARGASCETDLECESGACVDGACEDERELSPLCPAEG